MDAPNWYVGEEEIVTMGQDGEKEIKYEIKKDCYGNIVSWTVCSERVIKEVVNQVIYNGTFVPTLTYAYVQVPDLPEGRLKFSDIPCKIVEIVCKLCHLSLLPLRIRSCGPSQSFLSSSVSSSASSAASVSSSV